MGMLSIESWGWRKSSDVDKREIWDGALLVKTCMIPMTKSLLAGNVGSCAKSM